MVHRGDHPTADLVGKDGCHAPEAAAKYLRLTASRVTSARVLGHRIGMANSVAAMLTVEFDGDLPLSKRCATSPYADLRTLQVLLARMAEMLGFDFTVSTSDLLRKVNGL